MNGYKGRVDSEMVEQDPGTPRIFGSHHAYVGKNTNCPVGHVSEVANWRGNYVEFSFRLVVVHDCSRFSGAGFPPIIMRIRIMNVSIMNHQHAR